MGAFGVFLKNELARPEFHSVKDDLVRQGWDKGMVSQVGIAVRAF